MLELTSDGRPVCLSPGTSVQLEYNSPLFDEEVVQGSFSYSFAVPGKPNGPLYGFPERLDGDATPGGALPVELSLDGLPLLVGSQRVRSASASKYNVSLTGGLNAVAASLTERAIHTFAYGGFREVPASTFLQHANAVVAHPEGYDYVFAPVRVENFYGQPPAPAAGTTAPATPIPPAVLNPWLANVAGGTFMATAFVGFYRTFVVPDFWSTPAAGDEGSLVPLFAPFACPFPRLRYVLRSIFQEAGFRIDEPNFMPGELGELVIMIPANVLRTGVLVDGRAVDGFYLADALPDQTVAELLFACRKGLGLVVVVDEAAGLVRTVLLKDLVAAPASEVPDLTHCLAGAPEVTIDDSSALKLVYETDPDDLVTQALFKQAPSPESLAPAVATLADLPTTSSPSEAFQTRLVQAEGAYYRSTPAATSTSVAADLTWAYAGPYLGSTEVGGPDGQEYSQGFVYTEMGRAPFQADPTASYQLDPAATAYMEVPMMARAGFEPTNPDPKATPRPTALRLLFWRGLQPASDGSLYPLVTPLETNQAGQKVGALSLRLAGPAGTYEQLLRGWLEVKRRGVTVKQPLRLSVLDLARLNLVRKVRLDGIEYLVRKLSVAVPLRKPATAELVRV